MSCKIIRDHVSVWYFALGFQLRAQFQPALAFLHHSLNQILDYQEKIPKFYTMAKFATTHSSDILKNLDIIFLRIILKRGDVAVNQG